MASVWIRTRLASDGSVRYRVEFRPGGREAGARFAGSYRTKRLAAIRAAYVEAELAAGRIPELTPTVAATPAVRTLAVAADNWLATRIDIADATRTRHQSELQRINRFIGSTPVDALTVGDVQSFIAALVGEKYSRGTCRKTLQTLAMILDHAAVDPNPARDRAVKLPREEPEEFNPPTAQHVEAVYRLLPSKHRLPLLWLDWSGARVSSIDSTLVGDYDALRGRVRLRKATTKSRRGLWVDLPPALAEALEARLGPREDRNLEARLFPDSGADTLRTAIARACRAAGVPLFSPHDLRHRRISLLHLRGVPWARIGEFVGQRDLSTTADVYTHVLMDEAELDYAQLLA